MHNDRTMCLDVKSKDVLRNYTNKAELSTWHANGGILIKMRSAKAACHEEWDVINNNLHTRVPRCAHSRHFYLTPRPNHEHLLCVWWLPKTSRRTWLAIAQRAMYMWAIHSENNKVFRTCAFWWQIRFSARKVVLMDAGAISSHLPRCHQHT